MPPRLALFLGFGLVLYAFRAARQRGEPAPAGLIWATVWYLTCASRMLGFWLENFHIPLPGGSGGINEGSIVDAIYFLVLTMIGFVQLSRRNFRWGPVLRENSWVTALIVYMALSIIWSDYSYISFKRYVKVIGAISLSLVVLTTGNPLVSINTLLRRSLYIHLPMSIICIKYFRDIGVEFDWSGRSFSWKGIATSKNDLGQVALLGVLYFSFVVFARWKREKWKSLNMVYLLMALYLIKGSEYSVSVTSVSTCAFAMIVLVRLRMLRNKRDKARRFVRIVFYGTTGLVALIITHSIVMFSEGSLFGQMITAFGRDITLTDRTYIWHDVYAAASRNPLFGVGVGGFWIGRVANIPWDKTKTWVLGQAHSGYVDTYLQLGLIGSILMIGVIFTTIPKLIKTMDQDYDLACLRITLFLTIVFINVTESTYLRGDHHLWFIMQLVIWIVPASAWKPERAFLPRAPGGRRAYAATGVA